jgi:hypothetical protein
MICAQIYGIYTNRGDGRVSKFGTQYQ